MNSPRTAFVRTPTVTFVATIRLRPHCSENVFRVLSASPDGTSKAHGFGSTPRNQLPGSKQAPQNNRMPGWRNSRTNGAVSKECMDGSFGLAPPGIGMNGRRSLTGHYHRLMSRPFCLPCARPCERG
ncbi:MAG: hypothetical protein WC485_10895, partial [Opitutaceae bacterium]